jgi:hypothetical protein
VTNRHLTSRKVVLTAAFLALAAGGTAACDASGPDDGVEGLVAGAGETVAATGPALAVTTSPARTVEPAAVVDEPVEEPVDESGDDEVFYCADTEGEIVDEDLCDDDRGGGVGGGLFFLYLGGFGRGLPVGTVLPSGGTRINPGDAAARQRAGLPASGKVSAGQRVSGGIGSGIGDRAGTGAGS